MKDIDKLFKGHELVGAFGMGYLDKNLHGILKSDMILIGARTGAGKTTIANQLAYHNATNGIKVSLFSLENYAGEFELTEIFKECHRLEPNLDIDFREFKSKQKMFSEPTLEKAHGIFKENMKNIQLVSRKPDGFNIEDMEKYFMDHARKGSQLFIFDHIDYFDLHKPKATENENISDIMRAMRKLQDVYSVPLIVISHLRKGIKETIVPTLEDFMGTSNKVKEASMVILLAPDDDENSSTPDYIKRTWICIRKERGLGFFNTVCNVGFDIKRKMYEDAYEIHKVNYWGTKIDGENKDSKKKVIKEWQE